MGTCKRCKKLVEGFPVTKYGKPSTMCQGCYDDTSRRNAKKFERAKQALLSVGPDESICLRCKKARPIGEFEINPGHHRKLGRGERARMCVSCREYCVAKVVEYRSKWTQEKRTQILAGRRDYMRQFRAKVIAAYGGKCMCCGQGQFEFLAIDHVNNDGYRHRKQIGFNSEALYRWAEKHGFPDSLQCLCHNCNLAKAFYGKCPHEEPNGNTATQ